MLLNMVANAVKVKKNIMSNVSKRKRAKSDLPQNDHTEILYHLSVAVADAQNPETAATLLRDLLSYHEIEMIAKRLRIGKLLLEGYTYRDIAQKVHVGHTKIARVDEWLHSSGEGYRRAYEKIKGKDVGKILQKDTAVRLDALKRRYPLYYWPQIVLETIVKSATARQKKQIRAAVAAMESSREKTKLFRQLKKILS